MLLCWAGYSDLVRELTTLGTKPQLRSHSGDRDAWAQVLSRCSPAEPCGCLWLHWDMLAWSDNSVGWGFTFRTGGCKHSPAPGSG